MNSSRIGAFQDLTEIQKRQMDGENSKKYFKRVLLINCNIIFQKMKIDFIADSEEEQEKENGFYSQSSLEHFPIEVFNQFYSMYILGIINLNLDSRFKKKAGQEYHNQFESIFSFKDIYSIIKPSLHPFEKIMYMMMEKVNKDSQLISLTMLLNRNKENTPSCYEMKPETVSISYGMVSKNPDEMQTKKHISYDRSSQPRANLIGDNDRRVIE